MKEHAQVVVIGGGLIGCSIAYHLTKLGMSDVILCERDELTSGSTWHAAAGIHGLHDNNNVSSLQYYTMQLYKELEQTTGQGCGIFQPGSLYLAQTREREQQLRLQAAKARYFGVEFHEVSIDEARNLHPLVDYSGVRCVMFEPDGGNVDPSGVTHAYAKGARDAGARIERFTSVLRTEQQSDGGWVVETTKGEIKTRVLVNAAGLWAREVAQLAGIELPLIPMEHQYFVTESINEIETLEHRLPSVADRDAEYYLRQEGNGLLVGAYEKNARFWAEAGTPLDFGHELLADDLERLSDNLERAWQRLPVLAEAGIKRVINGPMIWSPDSSALFGPVPELKNYYCCNGIIPGFSQSGGLGMQLAKWIVEGEPEFDLFAWDLTRFDNWATADFTKARAYDCYTHRFKIHFPYEERSAGRPARTRPTYNRQQQKGAVFGLNYGWEHPLWFQPDQPGCSETYGFERQNWFEPVGAECRALRSQVGIVDISNFAKYRVQGQGSADWLDRVIANKVPRETGKSCLTPVLSLRGGIAGDFTITQLDTDDYWMVGSGMAERYHQRIWRQVDKPNSVTFTSMTDTYCGFNIAGPRSRELLSRLSNSDFSNQAWPFMRSNRVTIAGIEAIGLRVSFTGELGWEMYVQQDDQLALYDALFDAGAELGVVAVGSRSLLSLRVEKGYGSWGREYSPEYWPHEVGLERLIKMDKDGFLGKEAYAAIAQQAPRELLVNLSIDAVNNADAAGGEPIFSIEGTPIGRISSGAYGYSVEKSLALGFIKTEFANPGTAVHVAVLGLPHEATILPAPAYDETGSRLRS